MSFEETLSRLVLYYFQDRACLLHVCECSSDPQTREDGTAVALNNLAASGEHR